LKRFELYAAELRIRPATIYFKYILSLSTSHPNLELTSFTNNHSNPNNKNILLKSNGTFPSPKTYSSLIYFKYSTEEFSLLCV